MKYYRTIDWGLNDPTVVLYLAGNKSSRFYQLDEFYRSGLIITDAIVAIINFEKERGYNSIPFTLSLADPNGAGSNYIQVANSYTRYPPSHPYHYDFNLQKAVTEVVYGYQLLAEFLKPQDDGFPGLIMADNCVNTIRECSGLHYPEDKFGNAKGDRPVDADNHATDALKNFFNTLFPVWDKVPEFISHASKAEIELLKGQINIARKRLEDRGEIGVPGTARGDGPMDLIQARKKGLLTSRKSNAPGDTPFFAPRVFGTNPFFRRLLDEHRPANNF